MKIPFMFTAKTWHEVGDALAPLHRAMRILVNDNIQVADYGTGVKGILMVFVAVRPSNSLHENTVQYQASKKTLTIQHRLDYALVSQNSPAENQSLLATTYLTALETLGEKQTLTDFDILRLKKDMTGLFEAEGWLVREVV